MCQRLALAALVTLGAASAAASVGDVFGMGSRSAALAGAASALAEGFEATYYNPGRLAGPARFSAGFLAGASLLEVNGARQPIEDSVGILLGASGPIPLGGALRDRIHVGIGLFLLPDKIVRTIGHRPTDPHFPLFDNRTQRVVILPALSVEVHPRLRIGVGANVLAALGGRVDVGDGPLRALDARVEEELLTTFAFNAGVSIQPTPFVTLALTIREEFSLPFFTDSTTRLAGSDLTINLRARTLFEPTTVTLGTAVEVSDGVVVTGDLAYKRWSRFPGGLVAVSGSLPLPVGTQSEVPLAPVLPEAGFRDIFAVRAGVEWRAFTSGPRSVQVRGGYGFEPSPVPAQSASTSFLDGDKHTLAAGAGLARSGAFAVDAHLVWQHVGSSGFERDGARVTGGGSVLSGGLVGSYFFR